MIDKLSLEEQQSIRAAIEVFNRFRLKTVDDAVKKITKNSEGRIEKLSKNTFVDFLKITELYKLKEVARNNSNFYYSEREGIDYRRKETVAEHVCSCGKLADYFLELDEFSGLDENKVHGLLRYHDDIEIDTEEVCISDREKRKSKDKVEVEALPILASKYPLSLQEKLLRMDNEFRENKTSEAQFAHAIDKMDALIHELKYPKDWGPKGFDEQNVRSWFQPAFEYSPTFLLYFEDLVQYLKENRYFEK